MVVEIVDAKPRKVWRSHAAIVGLKIGETHRCLQRLAGEEPVKKQDARTQGCQDAICKSGVSDAGMQDERMYICECHEDVNGTSKARLWIASMVETLRVHRVNKANVEFCLDGKLLEACADVSSHGRTRLSRNMPSVQLGSVHHPPLPCNDIVVALLRE